MKRLAILLLFLTSGCACNNEDIPNIQVMKPTDKYLNCANLRKELVIADFQVRANISRLNALPAYAKNITCLPATQLQIEKSQNMAEIRVEYIRTLMREKKCEGHDIGPTPRIIYPKPLDEALDDGEDPYSAPIAAQTLPSTPKPLILQKGPGHKRPRVKTPNCAR